MAWALPGGRGGGRGRASQSRPRAGVKTRGAGAKALGGGAGGAWVQEVLGEVLVGGARGGCSGRCWCRGGPGRAEVRCVKQWARGPIDMSTDGRRLRMS